MVRSRVWTMWRKVVMNSSLFVIEAGVFEVLISSSSKEDTSHRFSFSILSGGSRLLGVAKGALW